MLYPVELGVHFAETYELPTVSGLTTMAVSRGICRTRVAKPQLYHRVGISATDDGTRKLAGVAEAAKLQRSCDGRLLIVLSPGGPSYG